MGNTINLQVSFIQKLELLDNCHGLRLGKPEWKSPEEKYHSLTDAFGPRMGMSNTLRAPFTHSFLTKS